MGIVIKIENDVVFIKTNDGSIRKYYVENFIKVPYINEKVIITTNGNILEANNRQKSKSNIFFIVLCTILNILLLCFLACGVFFFFKTAKECGNSFKSCITNFPG